MKDKMLDILASAQGQRTQKQGWCYDPVEGREIPEWVVFERKTMLDAVNVERAIRGLSPIDVETLYHKAERRAEGHSDYSRKFALYCAWLAEGKENHFSSSD